MPKLSHDKAVMNRNEKDNLMGYGDLEWLVGVDKSYSSHSSLTSLGLSLTIDIYLPLTMLAHYSRRITLK